MQVLAEEGIRVRSSDKSKDDSIFMIVVIIISSKQDYSSSSLRVNLEGTEEKAAYELVCCACRWAKANSHPTHAATILPDTPIFHPC